MICLLRVFPSKLLCELPLFGKALSLLPAAAFRLLPITAVDDLLEPNISLAIAMLHPQSLFFKDFPDQKHLLRITLYLDTL